MKDLILKNFNSLISEKSFKMKESKLSSVIHQTVTIENESIGFSFELDKRTKDFWVNVNLKSNDKLISVLNEDNNINIDFFLAQLDNSFKSCDSSLALNEKMRLYACLISKHYDVLALLSEAHIKKAIKLREEHFQSTFEN